jgi:polysaccharide export outer membrane protein
LCGSLLFGLAEPGSPAQKGSNAKSKAAATTHEVVASTAEGKTYVIGPEDLLAVRVWKEPELSGDFPVRTDGRISLPLVKELQAAGLTPPQLASTIGQALGRYMNRPEVSVAVLQIHSKKYFVMGEVQKSGSYPLTVPMTVLEALVGAGGFKDFANTKKILVLRGNRRFKFNYKEVVAGKRIEQNILLESGDKIIVP